MSGETRAAISGWSVDTLKALLDERHQASLRFEDERDRRYMEVNIEKEKALKIKETADLAALGLAREIQTYKDEKANELRTQLGEERLTYATRLDLLAAVEKIEATIKPVVSYVEGQRGKGAVVGPMWLAVLTLLGGLVLALILKH